MSGEKRAGEKRAGEEAPARASEAGVGDAERGAEPGVEPGAEPGVEPGGEPGAQPDAEAGAEAVRAALNRARAAARARGEAPGRPASGRGRRRAPGESTRSGAGPDGRDPQPFAAAIQRLVAERGWQVDVAVGGVMGRWDAIVGPDVAAHCRPETFEDGVLAVRADSTAWATQVRLLVPALMRRLTEEVGEGTVTKLVVRGPSGPSWRRGLRVAPGSQGPRDTYG